MKTKIKKIPVRDFNKVMDLFAESCRSDRFYRSVFHEDDCFSTIKQQFNMDVWRTLQYGEAVGAYVSKELIGVLLGVNLQVWEDKHRSDLDHLFGCSRTGQLEALLSYGQYSGCQTTYVYTICVDEQFRRRGIASELVKELCTLTKRESVVVSDTENLGAKELWLHSGFTFVDYTTEDDYQLRLFVSKA